MPSATGGNIARVHKTEKTGIRVTRSPRSLSTDPTTRKPQRRCLASFFRKTPKFNYTNGSESRPTQICVTTSSCRTPGMIEEINGCPHEEGQDYPLGEVCPACPFWAHRRRHLSRQPPSLPQLPPT